MSLQEIAETPPISPQPMPLGMTPFYVATDRDSDSEPAQSERDPRTQTLSALVVSYNSAATLGTCLDHLNGLDVVVIDNNSSDDSVAIARSRPGVEVVESARNMGLARALNLAASRRAGRDLLVINPDVDLSAEALDDMVRHMADDPRLGVVAPQLLGPTGGRQPMARSFPTLVTVIARRSRWLHRHRRVAEHVERHLNVSVAEGRPFWLLGACLLVRREAWDAIGGMNERFFLYFEDVDLCYRIRHAGWRLQLLEGVTARHLYARASKRTYALWQPTVRYHWRSALRWFASHPRLLVREPAFPTAADSMGTPRP